MTIEHTQSQIQGLSAKDRADVIYRAAQTELRARLWSAALGTSEPDPTGSAPLGVPTNLFEALTAPARRELGIPAPEPSHSASAPAKQTPIAEEAPSAGRSDLTHIPFGSPLDPQTAEATPVSAAAPLELGKNSRFAGFIEAAANRTGIQPAALAAIIDAEAAKKSDGTWNPASRNPRSSAAGLTQFLSGTWKGEAERAGTFLNGLAKANGWLDARGKVRPSNRAQLLALRFDARCAIEAGADYAKFNLEKFRSRGVKITPNPDQVAQLAYLGHHLGPGDASAFLTSGLSSERARVLLNAQVGTREAARRIQQAGSAVLAHKAWLTNYIDKRIVTGRFVASA